MMSCANIVVLRHIAKLSLSCVEKNMGRRFQLFVALLGNSGDFTRKRGENPRKIGCFLSCVRVGGEEAPWGRTRAPLFSKLVWEEYKKIPIS